MPNACKPINELNALPLAQRLVRLPEAHKGDSGKVLLIGGALTMAGALVLAGRASLYSGAGYTVLLMLDAASAYVVPEQPELMVHAANRYIDPAQALATIAPDVVAIGPGLGLDEVAQRCLHAALDWDGLLVIDADALTLLATHPHLLDALRQRPRPTALTPHPGEAARLLNTTNHAIQADRGQALQALVAHTDCIVVLKGKHSLVGAPGQSPQQCMDGNPGMAVGGMGDVLTGCLAALAAQGVRHHLSLFEATCLAVQAHALAADRLVAQGVGPLGLTPMEVALEIRRVINS
jgi:hydroxyethylthiazole kinase-like uncharacterized protein yjeF